jgi:hypothetical protein
MVKRRSQELGEASIWTAPAELWFTLVGRSAPMLIEAKALAPNGEVFLMQPQHRVTFDCGHGDWNFVATLRTSRHTWLI